jgi:DNA ligase (NAD+)
MERQELYTISNEFVKKEKSTFSQSDIKKLSEIIELHWKLYYQDENPVISDIDYDELFKKHEYFLEQSWEQISMFSKTWESFSQSSFKKVAHSRAMISLDNTYNAEDLRDFDTRINRILKLDTNLPYTIEFKFDGLWIELIYKDWVLTQAITRGNGQEGEDVTENIKQIKNIPKRINKTWVFEVRGEVVMPISSFERLNKEALENSEKVFSNPRNAASGSLRVLDTSITKKRDLQYFAYDVSDFSEFSQWKYSTMIEELENLGFEISSYFPKCKWIEEVIATIDNIWDIKKNIDFEIDGLVVKVNDISLWKGIWSTEHHPRYAIAYKFPAEIVTTKIESVEHSVGRTGSITPVANLAAVNIGGAVIRRATLHNYDEVEKLWVKIHDNVFLKRAGEVIPKIISVASSPYPDGSKEAEIYAIHPPKLCPSCQNKVLKDDDKVRYYCPNNYGCPAQMREKIAFAVGKQWFNIDGFWEKQAQLFLELW